jgi:hypothetical protein
MVLCHEIITIPPLPIYIRAPRIGVSN